jgi:hypothetical protein
MSYQKVDSEAQIEVAPSDEQTFFSTGNKLKMLGLFIAGVVAVCVVLASHTTGISSKVTMLNTKKLTSIKDLKFGTAQSTGSTESLPDFLSNYFGYTFDVSLVGVKKYTSDYGAFTPPTPIWGEAVNDYVYAVSTPGCGNTNPYHAAGIALKKCIPLGPINDADTLTKYAAVFTCDKGEVNMNVYTDMECEGEAASTFTVTSENTCTSNGGYSTTISCANTDFSLYSYGIKKSWIAAYVTPQDVCKDSTNAKTLDSDLVELYPIGVCQPKDVTSSDFSVLPTVVDGMPSATVFTEDNCEGASSVFTFETNNCENEKIEKDVYSQFQFQYNEGIVIGK